MTTASITETTITQADKVDAFETVEAFAGLIDGLYAATPADLNIVSTVGANQLWMSTQANANRNETVAQVLAGNGLSWMARGGIAADSDADEFGAFIGLARGMEGSVESPLSGLSGELDHEIPTVKPTPARWNSC